VRLLTRVAVGGLVIAAAAIGLAGRASGPGEPVVSRGAQAGSARPEVLEVFAGENYVDPSEGGGTLIDETTGAAFWVQRLDAALVPDFSADATRTVEGGRELLRREPSAGIRQVLVENTSTGPVIVASASGQDPMAALDAAIAVLSGGLAKRPFAYVEAPAAAVAALDTPLGLGPGALALDAVGAVVARSDGSHVDVVSVPGDPRAVAGLLGDGMPLSRGSATWTGKVEMEAAEPAYVLVSPTTTKAGRILLVRSSADDLAEVAKDPRALLRLEMAVEG
jgi:hypothetical protein